MEGLTSYADYFLIVSGASPRQVRAMAESMVESAKDQGNIARSVEGAASGKWVLIDFGDVVVHLFHTPARVFYDLEGLWADAPRVPVPAELLAPPARPA